MKEGGGKWKLTRCLSYNDVKKKRMLRSEKSRKNLEKCSKERHIMSTQVKDERKQYETVNHKYISTLPETGGEVLEMISEIKDVLTKFEKKNSINEKHFRKVESSQSSDTTVTKQNMINKSLKEQAFTLKQEYGSRRKLSHSKLNIKTPNLIIKGVEKRQEHNRSIKERLSVRRKKYEKYDKHEKQNIEPFFSQVPQIKQQKQESKMQLNITPIPHIDTEQCEVSYLNILTLFEKKREKKHIKRTKSKKKIPLDFFR